MPMGHCHVERVGGRAGETSHPMRSGISRRRRVERRGPPAKPSSSHRRRSLACPSAHPLGTTRASRLGGGINGIARSVPAHFRTPELQNFRASELLAFRDADGSLSCRAGGRPGRRDISPDAIRNLQAQKSRAARSSSKTVVFASAEVPRLPFRPPARDDKGESFRRGNQRDRSIGSRPLQNSRTPELQNFRDSELLAFRDADGSLSCRAGGRPGRRDISPDAIRNLQAQKSRAARSSSKTVVFASAEVPRLPFRPPARDDKGESARRGNQRDRSIGSRPRPELQNFRLLAFRDADGSLSCRAGGRPGRRDISPDAIRNLQAQKSRAPGPPAKPIRLRIGGGPSLALPPTRSGRQGRVGSARESTGSLDRLPPTSELQNSRTSELHFRAPFSRTAENCMPSDSSRPARGPRVTPDSSRTGRSPGTRCPPGTRHGSP